MKLQQRDSDQFPVLPVRTMVLLPGVVAPIEVGRKRSVRAVDAASQDDNLIVVVPQQDMTVDNPTPADLLDVGVVAEIVQVTRHGQGYCTVVLRGIERHNLDEFDDGMSYLVARATPLATAIPEDEARLQELMSEVAEHLSAVVQEHSDTEAVHKGIGEITDADELVDVCATHVELDRDDELFLLSEIDPEVRLRRVLPNVKRMHEVLRVKADIRTELVGQMKRDEREKALRERMRAIKQELGEENEDEELDEYRERLAASKMSDEARTAARRELARMHHMPPSAAEYNVSRTYIETLLDLPWGEYTKDILDVSAARAILDAEHSGLEKVKKRILEFIAVRKLAPTKQGPILCLVGPPGVGKTSLGRAISTALGRKYVRAALGGVRDETAIRGHRRTYVGALPGRIAASLTKAKSMNPVFVLDEVDKLGSDQRGDPTSAMLEVLDPEQNNAFVDHYLDISLDLSQVMFLATANQLDTIPGPLLDRMEVIRIPGYTESEKKIIARDHLLPKQLIEHGISKEALVVSDDLLTEVIVHYTREAGVRNLEREIASICRATAVRVAGGQSLESHELTAEELREILGPERFFAEVAQNRSQVGVATGLAWTPTGGDVLFIEARKMPGNGRLRLTGQLGDVMSESGQAAMSYVRAHADEYGISSEEISKVDIHLHVPSGSVKKEGPSAGVAITSALVSCLSGRAVRNDVAVTGEITLRGRVLPVGGIKEKVLAAHRAGATTLLLPERNKKDVVEVPADIRDDLDVRFVSHISEALALIFVPEEGEPPPPPAPVSLSEQASA